LPTATPEAVAFIDEVTRSREYPVVLFALEWCEFCWSVRKLFKKLDIPYRSVDLDSVEYQADNWGGAVRNALHVRVGSNTIPRVFVGGKHIGGCTDLFAAYRDGTLHGLLREHGITPASVPDLVPESLLPGWLHKRG
jgi:cysteine synthase A